MKVKTKIKVFLDDQSKPFGEFDAPVKFVLDSTKIADGKHVLKIVAKSTKQLEGIQYIPFEVRNGPAISVVGLSENDKISAHVPITINSYGSERDDMFVITGSETPKAIPSWVWALLIVFGGFALYYFISFWTPKFYTSFF